jgi:hypothetical protein
MEAEITIPDLFDMEALDRDNGAQDYTANKKEAEELEVQADDEITDENQVELELKL